MGKYELKAKATPYSSVVGGGVSLQNSRGHAKFQLAIIGTTEGVTKQENDEIAEQIVELINTNSFEVRKR